MRGVEQADASYRDVAAARAGRHQGKSGGQAGVQPSSWAPTGRYVYEAFCIRPCAGQQSAAALDKYSVGHCVASLRSTSTRDGKPVGTFSHQPNPTEQRKVSIMPFSVLTIAH